MKTPFLNASAAVAVTLIATVIGWSVTELPASAQAASTALGKQVDKIFAAAVGKQVPGAAVAILDNGRVLYKKGYGLADMADQTPMTTDSIFDLASCSKQFTSTAVMLLVQRGQIALNDSVRKYLPELTAVSAKTPVRIIDMLHMVSGLPSYQNALDTYEGKTNKDCLKAMASEPLAFPTGSKYEYSNTDYNLLATIVSRVSGKSFGEFARTEIFAPCGMTHTFVLEEAVNCQERVTGYKKEAGKWQPDTDDTPGIVGDGSVFSSIDDLILYDQALRNGKLLTPESFKLITTSGKLTNGSETGYGAGWNVQTDHGHTLAWHDGSWNGTSTYFARFKDNGTSIIVLTNAVNVDAPDLGDKIADAIFPGQ